MHLRTFEIFCAVAEQRSFSKAAAAHSLTQSAVSQAVQHLEESLGVQLIDRSQRPLNLTTAGDTYLRGLRRVLRSYQRLEAEVRGQSEQLSGQITVGSIYSVGLSYLPEATEEFARLHPEVEVRMEFGSSERVVEMTSEGVVDFGLVSFPKSNKQLQYVRWQSEPMRIVCASDHPLAGDHELTLAQLSEVEMIGFARGLPLREAVDQALAKAGVTATVKMEFDNADSMVRAIQANRGLGILPEAAVRRETANGSIRVVACREFRMTRPLGIIFRRAGRLSRAADEFGSLLLGRSLDAAKGSKSGSFGKLAEEREQAGQAPVSVVA